MLPVRDRRRARPLLVLALALAVVAAACSSDSTSDGAAPSEVRPFSEIQAGELVFSADPTNPSRGIMRVSTTEDLICSIAWGESGDLGNLNTDLSMAGTGHDEHEVVLPGAQPGTTYFYRVQGTGADGTLYQSALATFTISGDAPPTTTARSDVGENLALDATVSEVSSEFSDAWAAEQAIDDDVSTEWATAGDGSDGFISLDLGAPREIAAVEFVTRSMADGTATTTEYTVTVDDGEPLGPFPAGDLSDPRTATVDATGQVLRFDVADSSGGNTGAIEIRVFAPAR